MNVINKERIAWDVYIDPEHSNCDLYIHGFSKPTILQIKFNLAS